MKNRAFQIKLIVFSLLIFALFRQCERDMFPDEYRDIYGNWTVRNISGGFSGGSVKPGFDILEISHGMRFYMYRNDTLLSKGTIQITNETDDYLEVDFKSSGRIFGITGNKILWLNNDTLIISDQCADCYSAFFVRTETYSDPNYIQASRTLDFVEVTNHPIGFEKNFTSVYFQSEALGFLTCYDGSILKSSDGGVSWKQIDTKNSLPLYGISFLNDKVGFAVGGQSSCGGTGCKVPGYIMLKTADGGETWDSIPLPYKQADLMTIKFFPPDFGIAAGTLARLLTRDGGTTWTSFTGANRTIVNDVFLLNGNVAFLSGATYVSEFKAQLLKTTDGGSTWQDLNYDQRYSIQSLMFVNEQLGFIGFYNSLWKTNDGGLTWHKMDYAPNSARLINFSSENNGVVFGTRTYASNKWDVWDAYFNIMIDGKWYGDTRVSSHNDPFCLDSKTYYTITWDNKISKISITN